MNIQENNAYMEVRNIYKSFPSIQKRKEKKLVLENISFALRKGEKLAIVGASGCGKSTLLRILAGLDEASSGDVFLDGNRVSGPGKDRGFVFQKASLFPWLTVEKNIKSSRQLRINMRIDDNEISRTVYRANMLINLMGLQGTERLYPSQISGGMQQRVSIARALVANPKVLLMDEPFSALDSQTKENLYRIVSKIFMIENATSIIVTHDVNEAVLLCDRVIVLSPNPGRIDSEFDLVDIPRNDQGMARQDSHGYLDVVFAIRERIRSTTFSLEGKDIMINSG